MLLAALSTGHKLGLALVGAAFIGFALSSAFLLPALRPDFPGRRGLPAFLTLTVALFVSMLFAVFFFGREPKASHAAGAAGTAQTASPGSTVASPTTPGSKKIPVSETEFKIALPAQSLAAGRYELDLTNNGHVGHDLVVQGPGVSNEKTLVLGPGKKAALQVTLKPGTYDLYCSVDSHKQLGMDLKLKVT
ncbi:MAG TPA: plastocyanin/azurin family copper-binding protein [Gaiellaceae bacterium]